MNLPALEGGVDRAKRETGFRHCSAMSRGAGYKLRGHLMLAPTGPHTPSPKGYGAQARLVLGAIHLPQRGRNKGAKVASPLEKLDRKPLLARLMRSLRRSGLHPTPHPQLLRRIRKQEFLHNHSHCHCRTRSGNPWCNAHGVTSVRFAHASTRRLNNDGLLERVQQ
jgi:hypothetical protein